MSVQDAGEPHFAQQVEQAIALWDRRRDQSAAVLAAGFAISRQHVEDLRKSGLTFQTIRLLGFRSIEGDEVTRTLNWDGGGESLGPCLRIPYYDEHGNEEGARLKPDKPRKYQTDQGKTRTIKYEHPAGTPTRPYYPPGSRDLVANPSLALLITEGEKKGAKATQENFATVTLPGVSGWSIPQEKGPDGESPGPRQLLPCLAELPLEGRAVYIAFDSDAATNANVQREERLLAAALEDCGATVRIVRFPPGPVGEKVGLDDYLQRHPVDDLRQLMAEARPIERTIDAAYRFCALPSAEFFDADFRMRWYVQRMLVRGQPGVIGGPKKCLKTSTMIDLVVSLATGTPFLGHFKVYERTKVLFVSAESGEATIQETARRVCRGRGISPEAMSGWAWWGFRLPQFGSPSDVSEFRRGLSTLDPDGAGGVAILDPLYLALLAGADPRGVQAGNLYQVGPLLLGVAQACLVAGWTPLLCHHSTKHTGHEPLDLDDLAFAGISEFSRQWLLESRREPYEDGTGVHRLWLRAGGSAGHSSLWGVDVDEGCIESADDSAEVRLDSRRWEVVVTPAAELIEGRRQDQENAKQQTSTRQSKDDQSRILNAMDRLTKQSGEEAPFLTERKIREAAGVSGSRMTRAVMSLIEEGIIERGMAVSFGGKNNKVRREIEGIRRRNRVMGLTGQLTGLNGQSHHSTE